MGVLYVNIENVSVSRYFSMCILSVREILSVSIFPCKKEIEHTVTSV